MRFTDVDAEKAYEEQGRLHSVCESAQTAVRESPQRRMTGDEEIALGDRKAD